jgi:prepilin-type N-terminal cleavage/methylation domain-containing protein
MLVQRNRSAGFTLVEVIVAMTIFTMVIAGGLSGVRRGFDLIGLSRHHTRVSQILQSEFERLRTLSWVEFQELPQQAEVDIQTEFGTSVYDAYAVVREIFVEESDLARVELSVTYTNQNQRVVTVKSLTFFTKGGVNDYYYRTI